MRVRFFVVEYPPFVKEKSRFGFCTFARTSGIVKFVAVEFNFMNMVQKLFNLFLILVLPLAVSCAGQEGLDEGNIYDAVENESFVENPLMDDSATRLWTTPVAPDADESLTISFKAGKKSPLNGYTGDVYAHIGVLEYGVWRYVQAEWTENKPHCKFEKDPDAADTWHLELTPSVREYFQSGTTAITQIGIVIRSADGSLKGIAEDRFIDVTDQKYKPFQATVSPMASAPANCNYGINVVDNSTITFMLHDNNTLGQHYDYGYIIGDFNNWTLTNDAASQMSYDTSKGCWWITVSGLDATKEYRFQYHLGNKATIEGKSDVIVRLSDPFCEKVINSYDHWINEKYEIYPKDQMQYPDGGVGAVSCVTINRDNYAWSEFSMKNADCPVIYEMLLGDWTERGDLAGAMEHLDYLKTLGVNAVELMPIQEFDGEKSWGYNPNHYFALDKAYGTRKQYKDFIEACHQRGIAVIIDVVYNHSTGDSPLAKIYWNSSNSKTLPTNPYFFENARHDFNVFHDINHGNTFMQDLIKRSLVYLVQEYNVDGFRFDLSKGFTDSSSGWNNKDQVRIDRIKAYAKAIRSADPDSYIILEHWGEFEENVYVEDGMHPWKKFNGQFCETAMGWGDDASKANISGAHAWYDSTLGASGWVTFMESHDEERMAYKQEKYGHSSIKGNEKNSMENLAMNAVCFLGMPGPKMIWQMGELGYNYNKWCNSEGVDGTPDGKYETDRKPVRWDYLQNANRKALYDVYCKMNALRNNNPELFGKSAYYTGTMSSWPLKTFEVSNGSKKVYGYANFHGNNAASKTLNIPAGTYTDILTGKTVQGGSYVLNSGQALVLVGNSVVK